MSGIVWIPKSMRDEKIEITKEEGYDFYDEYGNLIYTTKIVLEKKKKEYPKTYEECWYELKHDINHDKVEGYKSDILSALQKLLICRDVYWKIAGEEFNWDNALYYIYTNDYGNVIESDDLTERNCVLAFPDKASRDAFYENFKSEIEICKELL